MYNSWKGKQHIALQKLHETYGPIVRIGPQEVSVTDSESIKLVLGPNRLPKGPGYETRRDERTGGSLLLLHGDLHRNRRRLWNRGMNTDALREYEQVVIKKATVLVESLDQAISKNSTLDIHKWLSYFTFDFMAEMAFGDESSNLMTSGKDEQGYLEAIKTVAKLTDVFTHVPIVFKLLQRVNIPFFSPVRRMRNMGMDWSNARLKRGAQYKDLWYYLSDEAGIEKTAPSIETVAGDGQLAIIAGSDTTSGALANTLWFLLSNPQYYQQLQKEIDQVYPPEADALDVTQHHRLPFLSACLRESLRVMPPVPTNGPRQVPKGSGGSMIHEHFLPEGVKVLVPPYCVHRNPDNFYPQPEAFVPTRWLDQADGDVHVAEAFIPFSYGPANCAGRNLAMREMMMVMSLLIQRFEFKFADGFDAEGWLGQTEDHFVSSRKPLELVVIRRV